MSLGGPSGVNSGLRGAEFLQDLTGIRLPSAPEPRGSTTVPGMGTVAVAAQPVPVRQGGQPTPAQAARSPATQSSSSIGQKILQALTAVWNFFMAPALPLAPAAARQEAQRLVQEEASGGFREFIDGGTPTGAHEVFWKDLNRANFTVQLPDGTSRRIDVKGEEGAMSSQQQAARKMQSIDQVRQLCGGDEALTRAVMKMAHQGLVAAAQMPFMPSQPGMGMVMPNGSLGVPLYSGDRNAVQESSYALSAGPGPGEISIRAGYSLRGATMALTDRGGLALDPARSGYTASITIAVSVDAGGVLQARVTDPLRAQYAVGLARA